MSYFHDRLTSLFVAPALIIYMSLTALVFAAWNVGASRAAGARGESQTLER